MNLKRLLTIVLFALFCGKAVAQTQDVDKTLSDLADKIAASIKEQGKKKVTVLDFTDLQGGSSELGRYVAEQLTVNLVIAKRNFSVLDRANLKSILAEHKLTATGLVDPENAKKLGMFAGVDAIILGTITPKSGNISLTVKIITTDTAEIVGAAKAVFKEDEMVKDLESHPAAEGKATGKSAGQTSQAAKVSKIFGNLRIEVQPLQIVNAKDYVLTLALSNQSQKKSVWVALNTDIASTPKATITDPDGNEFVCDFHGISGIEIAFYHGDGFSKATEIKPGDSISATVKFFSRPGRAASPGQCKLQMELLSSLDFFNSFGHGPVKNFITKIETE